MTTVFLIAFGSYQTTIRAKSLFFIGKRISINKFTCLILFPYFIQGFGDVSGL
jgi:hypothetical protein